MVKSQGLAVAVFLAALCASPGQARISASPGGQLLPGCTCPIITPRLQPELHEQPQRQNVPEAQPHDVEVLTVDVGVANRVRCDNASIADDIAKILKIPVQRVTVTPWSWTGVAQGESSAFVQEDHDRCDCKGQAGKVVHGQGFRKVTSKGAVDGWALGPDTSVMTVSQYKALQAASKKAATSQPSPSVTGPPSAKVQMLTRDPCLVQLLRSETPSFQKRIAYLLGLPDDKVIIDPPPVKGTIGLVQLETAVKAGKEIRQVPVLAVQQCNGADLSKLEKDLPVHLLSQRSAAGDEAARIASLPAVYAVASNTTHDVDATDESNRAWIAFWNIELLPPFAEEGAWRLLNMINTPRTQLSKALPMTLARVPGLKYRTMQGPNAMSEVRLPPPEDKAVGFHLPKPQTRSPVSKENNKAFQEDTPDREQIRAQEALQHSQRTATMIKQAGNQFAAAARSHALAVRGQSLR